MLKEQVITPRAGRGSSGAVKGRGGGGGGGVPPQRPARRQPRGTMKKNTRVNLRALAPVLVKVMLAVFVGVSIFWAYRTAASSAFFAVRAVEVGGTTRASKDEITTLVRRAASAHGVWDADLRTISREVGRQPWVRTAVVSRVLPSGLRVRVTERVPRAVARAQSGRLVWVDDDGVMVSHVSPNDEMPAFFLRGWDTTAETDAARAENKERVKKFLELMHEWEASALARRVSEVNLGDVRDVRAQLAGNDSEIEVRLGREDLTKRLRQALEVLDEQRATPRGPFITYVDMTRGKSAVVGSKPNAVLSNTGAAADGERREGGGELPSLTPRRNGVAPVARQERTAAAERDEGTKEERRPKRENRRDG
ncbi:MAG: FtsQ-type POTRA domain-containing protein [Pyrinomonadaceae bacterium]|nr:FtsQ-type POTRA domain-containing protein [Pyrinomonadaceae bacterium]